MAAGSVEGLVEQFRAAGRDEVAVRSALGRLLAVTDSRAAGLWRVQDGLLCQLGFEAVADMPVETQVEFRALTRSLGLEQTGYGIVKAAVTAEPTIGRLDPQETGLAGSANWLVRFESQQSLAMPIRTGGRIRGVVAISRAETFGLESDSAQILRQLAAGLSEMLAD